MADTNFINLSTVVTAPWLNDINKKVYRHGSTPFFYNGVGDGVVDDTSAIQAAVNAGYNVDLSNRPWKITSTINVPSNRIINLRGATINAACGANPVFRALSGPENITIEGSGLVFGTASAFLFVEGTTHQPSSIVHYSRQIRVKDLLVSSATIGTFLYISKAANEVFVDNCMVFTPNGILSDGKGVEVHITNSILYGATAAAGTKGIGLSSTGGTSYFNEGWHIQNCTIDNYQVGLDVKDIYVLAVTNCYIGGSDSAFTIRPPSTNLTEDIAIHGNVIVGPIKFKTSAGTSYHAVLNGNVHLNMTGYAVDIELNAANIMVSSSKFKGGGGTAIAVRTSTAHNSICIKDLEIASDYAVGVQCNITAGTGHSISGLSGQPTELLQLASKMVNVSGMPIYTATGHALKNTYNTPDLQANVTVGSNISSLSVNCAKGETGVIDISLGCTGMNAATQRFQLTLPTGMVVPTGTGWSAIHMYPSAAGALVAQRIPYYCTQDISAGTLALQNAVGNTVTISSHSRFGISRDW